MLTQANPSKLNKAQRKGLYNLFVSDSPVFTYRYNEFMGDLIDFMELQPSSYITSLSM